MDAVGNPYAEELQMERGFYLNAMALADLMLTNWFVHRLGVPFEEMDTFARLVQTGSLGARIELFAQLDDSPQHKQVAEGLREANTFRNELAHGQVFPAADPNSSFPEIGEQWELEVLKRTGRKRVSVTAAEIRRKRKELVEVVNELLRLAIDLPRR
jgi:hypothetical protein